MIKMIKGIYGLVVNGTIEAKNKHSEPFALSEEREAELIAAGVAVKVEEPEQPKASARKRKPRKVSEVEEVPQLYDDDKRYSGLLTEE